MSRFLPIAVGTIAFLVTGCATGAGGPGAHFRVLAHGARSDVHKRRFVVIRDRENFAAWWRRTGATRAPPPAVDFSHRIVVALFIGERRTGGYRIDVSGVSRSDDVATVHVREQAPGTNCRTTQALTQPFTVVSMDKVHTVRFDIRRVEKPC